MKKKPTKKKSSHPKKPLHHHVKRIMLHPLSLFIGGFLVIVIGLSFVTTSQARIVGSRLCSSNSNCASNQYCSKNHICLSVKCDNNHIAAWPVTSTHRSCPANWSISNHQCVYSKYCVLGSGGYGKAFFCKKGSNGATCSTNSDCQTGYMCSHDICGCVRK